MIWWIILLFLAGLLLIQAECFVPGGICGTLGLVLIIVSCTLGYIHYPGHGLLIIVGETLGAVGSFGLALYLFPRTSLGRKLALNDSQRADQGWVASKTEQSLKGKTAEVYTALRPAGTILLDGRRIDAVSDGQYIDKGAKVRVIQVHGSRVVVEKETN